MMTNPNGGYGRKGTDEAHESAKLAAKRYVHILGRYVAARGTIHDDQWETLLAMIEAIPSPASDYLYWRTKGAMSCERHNGPWLAVTASDNYLLITYPPDLDRFRVKMALPIRDLEKLRVWP